MKNIHILPTTQPSRLWINTITGKLVLDEEPNTLHSQNIYITSAEEIKVGDWYYLPRTNSVHKCIEDPTELNLEIRLGVAKIIITTDQDLIKDGIQVINDDFLEWFVKNPTCENVEVNKMSYGYLSGFAHAGYKIIIPKEEQKQHIIDMMKSDEELGLYEESKQDEIMERFIANAKQQETLEEVAENYSKQFDYPEDSDAYFDFIEGAKWQQGRSYSEEEVETIAKDAYTMGRNNILIGVFNKWFQQFKKK